MSFIPEGYELPKGGNSKYLKLQDGDNKIRILSDAIFGFEYFDNDNRVHRSKTTFSETPNIKPGFGGKPGYAKHFMAMIALDLVDNNVKILEVTQNVIKEGLITLAKDTDWGDPKQYNINIKKSGKLQDTTYSVLPGSKTEIDSKYIKQSKEINLEALYDGLDPFAKKNEVGEDMDVPF